MRKRTLIVLAFVFISLAAWSAVTLNGKVFVEAVDFFLQVAQGNISGKSGINKFGRASNVDNGVATDIWDGANATTDQDIWIAPTQARIHQITSGSASDDGDPVGVGARTIRISGLTSWSALEVSEDIILNGASDVATANVYVIIHRMQVITKGATNINVGIITATADTDGTITAQINAGQGQTQMAIYGVPSIQIAYMTKYYSSFNKSGGQTGAIDLSLLVNPGPDVEIINFLTKHTQGLFSVGTSLQYHRFEPHFAISGPAIIKLQAIGSADNLDLSGGFDLILVDN
jgi:hypothetical protein